MMADDVVVMDCGAGNMKIGFANSDEPKILPNCTAKSKSERKFYIGDGIWSSQDLPSLYFKRPYDRGYLVNWDVQKDVWDRAFCKEVLKVTPAESTLLLSEPILNPNELRDTMDEFVFEEYGFKAYCSMDGPSLCYYDHCNEYPTSTFARTGCGVIVDSGFSFSHVVPFFHGKPILPAAKRVCIGGKALTNLLMEQISYRQFDMRDELFLVSAIKERLCYCSLDFLGDLEVCRKGQPPNHLSNPNIAFYSLPSGREQDPLGSVMPQNTPWPCSSGDQVLVLNNERISIPEVLFHPSNIGVDQAGIAETVYQAISSGCPKETWAAFMSAVVLCGGNTMFPNLISRFDKDLRTMIPDDVDLKVYSCKSGRGDLCAWRGGCAFSRTADFPRYVVTKAEYEEKGHLICRSKFGQQQQQQQQMQGIPIKKQPPPPPSQQQQQVQQPFLPVQQMYQQQLQLQLQQQQVQVQQQPQVQVQQPYQPPQQIHQPLPPPQSIQQQQQPHFSSSSFPSEPIINPTIT